MVIITLHVVVTASCYGLFNGSTEVSLVTQAQRTEEYTLRQNSATNRNLYCRGVRQPRGIVYKYVVNKLRPLQVQAERQGQRYGYGVNGTQLWHGAIITTPHIRTQTAPWDRTTLTCNPTLLGCSCNRHVVPHLHTADTAGCRVVERCSCTARLCQRRERQQQHSGTVACARLW